MLLQTNYQNRQKFSKIKIEYNFNVRLMLLDFFEGGGGVVIFPSYRYHFESVAYFVRIYLFQCSAF